MLYSCVGQVSSESFRWSRSFPEWCGGEAHTTFQETLPISWSKLNHLFKVCKLQSHFHLLKETSTKAFRYHRDL